MSIHCAPTAMRYHLPSHMSFGLIGERAVALDLDADRYFLLADAEATALSRLGSGSEQGIDPIRTEQLARRGFLGTGEGAPIAAVDAAALVASALELHGSARNISVWEAGTMRLLASLSLRVRGLADTVARWRRLRAGYETRTRISLDPGTAVEGEAAACARGFAEARLLIPARRRCVPDSLALVQCLWRRGIAADLYFGVRLAPFAAHCWVQRDALLLSDPFDIVREFTPVFRL